MQHYFLEDGELVYRRPGELGWMDVFFKGKWQAATGKLEPSEQDLEHLDAIPPEVAEELTKS